MIILLSSTRGGASADQSFGGPELSQLLVHGAPFISLSVSACHDDDYYDNVIVNVMSLGSRHDNVIVMHGLGSNCATSTVPRSRAANTSKVCSFNVR